MAKIKKNKNFCVVLFLGILLITLFFNRTLKAELTIFGSPRYILEYSNFCSSITIGDIDNDGDLDVALVINFHGDFVVFNDGSANFFDFSYLYGYGQTRNQVALADIELDGDLDFFSVQRYLLNDGTGNFVFGGALPSGPRAIAVGDVNGDKFPDVVRQGPIFLNDQSGGFYPGQSVGGGEELNVALGDIDNDGDLDVAGGGTIWINDGNANFVKTSQNLHIGGTFRTWGMTFADFNGDGYLDLAIGEKDLGSYVMINNGTGHFTWTGERLSRAYSVAAGDLDLDGNCDIVTSDPPAKVYLGNGNGLFGDPVQSVPVNGYAPHYDVALGDLNGDKLLDLVLTGTPTAYLNVLPNIILVNIDINPDTLKLKSKGKFVTTYIELPEGYFVEDIDVSKVAIDEINGIALVEPIYAESSPTEIGDNNHNGIPDLMVKFNRQDLISLLSPGHVEITVSGTLKDGATFKGSDIIKVIE